MAVVDAVGDQVVPDGSRVPAERQLAAALGVSRGTVVACLDHLVAAGVVRRRHGSGTFVVSRPSWALRRPSAGGLTTLLLRRMATAAEGIDVSMSVPGTLGHLPAVEARNWRALDGHGLDPAGLADVRAAIADHLTRHQQLPTTPDQLVVTAGAQEALMLLGRILGPRSVPVLASCPTYPGLAPAMSAAGRAVSTVTGDRAGVILQALERALAGAPAAPVYVMPSGHNPTGSVMPAVRRDGLAALADRRRAVVIEDLSLADLVFDEPPPAPIAARSPKVVAVGSVSKLLWAGLRVGWVRGEPDLVRTLVAHKSAVSLATSAPAQLAAADLLAAIDDGWLDGHRRALKARRDHLLAALAAQLPAWRSAVPPAGLSVWSELPVADAFTHVAARHGVTVTPGNAACLCGGHRDAVRISFAEQIETLDLAVERLVSAWQSYSEDVAASPAGTRRAAPGREPDR